MIEQEGELFLQKLVSNVGFYLRIRLGRVPPCILARMVVVVVGHMRLNRTASNRTAVRICLVRHATGGCDVARMGGAARLTHSSTAARCPQWSFAFVLSRSRTRTSIILLTFQ